MTWSQIIVVSWIQFTLAAAVLLHVSRRVLARLNQPADRIRLIQFSLIAVMLTPLLMYVAPWPLWTLHLVTPLDQGQTISTTASIATNPIGLPETVSLEQSGDTHQNNIQRQHMLKETPDVESTLGGSPVGSLTTPANASSQTSQTIRDRIHIWSLVASAVCLTHGFAILYLLIEWGLGTYWLQTLCRKASPATEAVVHAWNQITRGRGGRVRLLTSPSIDAPLMYGNRRPTVVLSKEMADAGEAALAFCLAHEWSHIQRQDMCAWQFVRVCQCFLWFQPAYWELRSELRLQQDILADDFASRAKVDAAEYSELLVGLARNRMSASMTGALTLLDRPSQLMKRIKMLLENPICIRSRPSWKFSCVAASVTLLSTLVISSIRVECTRANDSANNASAKTDLIEGNDKSTASPNSVETTASGDVTDGSKRDQASESITRRSGPMKYTWRVVDRETDQVIRGVTVKVKWRDILGKSKHLIQETQTTSDVNGEYTIEIPDVPISDENLDFEAWFQHEDYAIRGIGCPVKGIREQEQLTGRTGYEATSLKPADLVTGTIVSPDGQPISGTRVYNWSGFFEEADTDSEGKFRFKLGRGDDATALVVPKNFAILKQPFGQRRGDLGTIKLSTGVRVSGRLLGIDGKPTPNVHLNIQPSGLHTGIRRDAVSDSEGRFSFDPLAAGDYDIHSGEGLDHPPEPEITGKHSSIPAVFPAKKLTLKEGQPSAPVEIQALPNVIINVQIVDSAGRKADAEEFRRIGGIPFGVNGNIDGAQWYTRAQPDRNGKFTVPVPHGLQNAFIQVLGSPRTSAVLKIRHGRDKPLQHLLFTELGTINDDIDGIEIVRFQPGVALISAVDENQKPITNIRIESAYQGSSQRYVREGESRSDVRFERQLDGRYRSVRMYPDEDVSIKVTSQGYEPASERINVAEGTTREIVLTLKKNTAEQK